MESAPTQDPQLYLVLAFGLGLVLIFICAFFIMHQRRDLRRMLSVLSNQDGKKGSTPTQQECTRGNT